MAVAAPAFLADDTLPDTLSGLTTDSPCMPVPISPDEDRRDPPPQPPVAPDPADCCNSGCTRCVLVLHDEALERWRSDLEAWRQRNPDAVV